MIFGCRCGTWRSAKSDLQENSGLLNLKIWHQNLKRMDSNSLKIEIRRSFPVFRQLSLIICHISRPVTGLQTYPHFLPGNFPTTIRISVRYSHEKKEPQLKNSLSSLKLRELKSCLSLKSTR